MKKNPWKMTTLVLTAVLGGVVAYQNVPLAFAGSQPHMDAALKHLNDARSELQQAETNKGGHRELAIGNTDNAIRNVKDGIEWARTH